MENSPKKILEKHVADTNTTPEEISLAMASREQDLINALTQPERAFLESYSLKLKNYKQASSDIERAKKMGRSSALAEQALAKIKKEIDLTEDYMKNDSSLSDNIKQLINVNYHKVHHKDGLENEQKYLEKILRRNTDNNLDEIIENIADNPNTEKGSNAGQHSTTEKQTQIRKNINNPIPRNLN